MDTVKEGQELTIGNYKCAIRYRDGVWWCANTTLELQNTKLFTQFGITKEDIYNILEYKLYGDFPECKSAEDLTKVIEFILSKDPANQSVDEDYTGRTIRALVDNPEDTTVKVGEKIKILKVSNVYQKYMLDKTATGYAGMVIKRPLDLKQWELVEESSTDVDMEEIQAECIKRFPIGCTYKSTTGATNVLEQDHVTYEIVDYHIYAHNLGGSLYQDGKYATLVSFPEEKPFVSRFKIGDWVMYDFKYDKNGPYELKSIYGMGFLDQNGQYRETEDYNYRRATRSEISEETLSIPEYVEAINKSDGYTIGTIYKTLYSSTKTNYRSVDDKGRENGWGAFNFKPSTKEAYDAQFISTTFALPERWCLKITSDTKKVLDEWRKRQPGFNELSVGFKGWLVSDKRDGTYTHWNTNVPDRYKEITYGQFLSHVLNPVLYDLCSKGIESLIEKERDAVYAYVGDPKVKTKPLIEDVQSVSVNLRTKKKTNKFKF